MDFIYVYRKLIYLTMYFLVLPLYCLCFLLLFNYHLLELFPIFVKLTALILDNLSPFLNLNDSCFESRNFVTHEPLRLHFLFSKLTLQCGNFALVSHVVVDYWLSWGVKRGGRLSRTVKLWKPKFCLRTTSHFCTLVQSAHTRANLQLISRPPFLAKKARACCRAPCFIKMWIFFNNFDVRSIKIVGFV